MARPAGGVPKGASTVPDCPGNIFNNVNTANYVKYAKYVKWKKAKQLIRHVLNVEAQISQEISQDFFTVTHSIVCNLQSLIMYKDRLGLGACFLTGPTQVLCSSS